MQFVVELIEFQACHILWLFLVHNQLFVDHSIKQLNYSTFINNELINKIDSLESTPQQIWHIVTERIEHIDSKECKGQKTITIHLKGGNEPRLMLSPQVRVRFFSHCLHIHIHVIYTLMFISSCFFYLCVVTLVIYILYIYIYNFI